jgi:hypothetical protein
VLVAIEQFELGTQGNRLAGAALPGQTHRIRQAEQILQFVTNICFPDAYSYFAATVEQQSAWLLTTAKNSGRAAETIIERAVPVAAGSER